MKKVVKLVIVFLLVVPHFFIVSNASINQTAFTEINTIHTGSRTTDVCVNDDVLYALDLEYGLQIYDISDPTSPKRLGGYYDSYTFSHGLCYNEELIFIADYEDKLEIIDVTDPNSPQLIGRYRETNSDVQRIGTTNLHIFGNFVFLASQGEGVEIIDVTDPTHPVEIGNYYVGNSINVVHATSDLIFIREQGGSFKILNITDPTTPNEIYYCTDVSVGQNFLFMDDSLYIPDSDFGLRIFDITNPSNPVKIGEKSLDGECMKCIIETRGSRSYAFLTAMDSGIYVCDVTNPQNVIELAQWNDGGQSFSPFVQDDLVYVAEFSGGLEILKIEGISHSTEITSSISDSIFSSSFITITKTAKISSFEIFLTIIELIIILMIKKRHLK